jgi:RecA-family ATPase
MEQLDEKKEILIEMETKKEEIIAKLETLEHKSALSEQNLRIIERLNKLD